MSALVDVALSHLRSAFEDLRPLAPSLEDRVIHLLSALVLARWQHAHARNATTDDLTSDWESIEAAMPVLRGSSLDLPWLSHAGAINTLEQTLRRLRELAPSVADRDLGLAIDQLLDEASRLERRETDWTTPSSINILLVALAQLDGARTVLDPCCGSGGTLVAAARTSSVLRVAGQDANKKACTIARLRLALEGFVSAKVDFGDSLAEPRFLDRGRLATFDRVISHLPEGAAWNNDRGNSDRFGRYDRGVPPRQRADAALMLHALASTAERGRCVLMGYPGLLYRTGVEEQIRRSLLESDLFEAVVELPAGSLTDTHFAPVIMSLSRRKQQDSRSGVLFVRAGTPAHREGRSRRQRPPGISREAHDIVLEAFGHWHRPAGHIRRSGDWASIIKPLDELKRNMASAGHVFSPLRHLPDDHSKRSSRDVADELRRKTTSWSERLIALERRLDDAIRSLGFDPALDPGENDAGGRSPAGAATESVADAARSWADPVDDTEHVSLRTK